MKDKLQYIDDLKLHAEDLNHFIKKSFDISSVKSEKPSSSQVFDPKEELKETYSDSFVKQTPHFSDIFISSPKQEFQVIKPINIALPKYEPREEVQMID